jgi:hypothetical protein
LAIRIADIIRCIGAGHNTADGLNVANVSDTSATLNWGAIIDTITTFNIQYRVPGTVWTTVTVSDTILSYNLTGLTPCTTYQFQIEMVCESYNIGDTFFPTEKTVRPISAGKPMLVYGPKHFLARLRALGFQTYNNCWSEDYDQFEGPARWKVIQQIITELINLNDFQRARLLDQAQNIAIYNRRHLAELIK